ncbi:MAG: hypothetical protein JWM07_709 [Candidatus Saccharibacteria bacterium]|nr:hypothetical protein [Candidatus Saccharibacteria bacterium]
MPSTTSLVSSLHSDFPGFIFRESNEFHWSPRENTIFYDHTSDDCASLLHELAHAILQHTKYAKDIQLIEMERDAWDHATTTLAPIYTIEISHAATQDALDTYRDWLHARSTCPHCKATGIQSKKNQYRCVLCSTKWRVNDARICALRRYAL